MSGIHYDNVVAQVEDELWTYAETMSPRGRRVLKVFFYDYGEGRCYVELEEKDSGLLQSNADYYEYLAVAGEEIPTDDLDSSEAMDLLYAASENTFPGYFSCDEPGYSGWFVDGEDYSTEEHPSSWYWRDDIVEIRDREDLDDWQKDDIYYEAGRRIAMSDYDIAEDDPGFDEAALEASSNIINLFSISAETKLYSLLPKWYDHLWQEDPDWGRHHGASEMYAEMEDNIRNCFYKDYCLWFVTGTGYAIMSSDLLGGTSDGRAERAFDLWSEKQD